MLSLSKNVFKVTYKISNIRTFYLFIGRNSLQIANYNFLYFQSKTVPCYFFHAFSKTFIKCTMHNTSLELNRHYSKKKGSKRSVEVEEESDSEEEDDHDQENIDDLGDNILTKTVPSMRLDSVLKASLGLTKKKIEQEFYAFKLRINGNKVLKKSLNIHTGDEIDRIKGFSPDTSKYLIVDRVIIKSIGSITGSGMFPLKMEILKQLPIENYEDPWDPSLSGELEK